MKAVQLDHLFHRYPQWPSMREAARNWLRELTRNHAAGCPLTGSFYWVPTLDDHGILHWQIKEFFDEWASGSDHISVWPHVRDYLQSQWHRNLHGVGYCSLPRGRVCRSRIRGPDGRMRSQFVIYQGNDWPKTVNSSAVARVRFNLPVETLLVFDIHEQTIPGEPELLSETLGIDVRPKSH
jgi:hypothetical protein